MADDQLPAKLDAVERAITAPWSGAGAGAALELIRAVDSEAAACAYPDIGRSDELDAVEPGLAIALSYVLAPRGPMGGLSVLGVHHSTTAHRAWAQQVLLDLGLVAQLRRWHELSRQGLLKIETLDNDVFEVRQLVIDAESYDRKALEWVDRQTARQHRRTAKKLRKNYPLLQREVSRRTQMWLEGRLWYDFSQDVEDEFITRARLRLKRIPGTDNFEESIKLGPLTFGQWRDIIAREVAKRFRHIESVLALTRKHKGFQPGIAITEIKSWQDVVEYWAHHLGCAEEIASEAAETIMFDAATAKRYARDLEIPFPLFVVAATGHVIEPVFGALRDPFFFAWRQIRSAYQADWDRAVNLRERKWRAEFRDLLPPPWFDAVDRPRTLRVNGKHATDIDAVILDCRTGALALFQLKWQEMAGRSPKERLSRAKNLMREGTAWIAAVSEWMRDRDAAEIAKVLGLSNWRYAKRKPVLFVVGRYGANFTMPQHYDTRAAWCSWFEIQEYADLRGPQFDLDELHLSLIIRDRFAPVSNPQFQRFRIANDRIELVASE